MILFVVLKILNGFSQFTLQICFVPITVMQCFREFVWCTIILNIKKIINYISRMFYETQNAKSEICP